MYTTAVLLRRALCALFALTVLAQAGCGGDAQTSTSAAAQPTVSAIYPATVQSGSPDFTLTVSGYGFDSSSVVQWNGSARPTTFVSSVRLTARIAAADVAHAGAPVVTVVSAAAGGAMSNAAAFQVSTGAALTQTSLAPASIVAGSAAFVLTVTGSGFAATSTVNWNGAPRATTLVSAAQLQAQILASDVQAPGDAAVSVTDSSSGQSSNLLFFHIVTGTPGISVNLANVPANDVVWDAADALLFVSVPSTGGIIGNCVAAVNPSSGALVEFNFAGSEPDRLAISDDDTFLYVGLDQANSVQRFALPNLGVDVGIPLGLDPAGIIHEAPLDIAVAPGTARTTAIALGIVGQPPVAIGGLKIFDDALPRPVVATTRPAMGGIGNYDTVQWGGSASTLYAAENESTNFDFYTLTVDASGVTQTHAYPNSFQDFHFRIHFDRGTGLVYSDLGDVIDPATGKSRGHFGAGGVMVPDSGLGRAYFIGQLAAQTGTPNYTLQVFDLNLFTPIGQATLSNIAGMPTHLVRWGSSGLAFSTSGGPVYLLTGSLVNPAASAGAEAGAP